MAKKLLAVVDYRIEPVPLFFLLGSSFLVSPFFFAVMVNVIRQGTAVFALLVAYVLLVSRVSLLTLIPFFIIAEGFHHTSLIGIVFSPLVLLNYRTIIYLVMISSSLYLCGLSEHFLYLVSRITPIDLYSKFHNYGLMLLDYKRGVRVDFAIFSLVAGLLFQQLGKYLLNNDDRFIFYSVLKIYWVLILPFFFFGFTVFSDRYLLTGWLSLSVVGAIFLGFFLKKQINSMCWYYGMFSFAVIYFYWRVTS